uniref:Uncharacterized protein n=1 Tax=Tanacetum cinerariifolium TaxID=118510 RepID=A0A6L2P9T7_TANCI|nr:hypothetical protein [Tanacetum cinerariifolium]
MVRILGSDDPNTPSHHHEPPLSTMNFQSSNTISRPHTTHFHNLNTFTLILKGITTNSPKFTTINLVTKHSISVNSEHKQLRVFLEEQHKAYETETQEEYETANAVENENNPQNMKVEEKGVTYAIRFPVDDDLEEEEEDEESRHQRGKGNIDKWLQLLMGEEEGMDQSTQLCDANGNKIDEIIRKMNLKYPRVEALNNKEPEIVEMKSLEEIVVKNHPYKITARRSSVSDPKLSTMKSLSLELDIPVSRVINVIFLFVLIYVNQYVTPNTKVLTAAYPIWSAAT